MNTGDWYVLIALGVFALLCLFVWFVGERRARKWRRELARIEAEREERWRASDER